MKANKNYFANELRGITADVERNKKAKDKIWAEKETGFNQPRQVFKVLNDLKQKLEANTMALKRSKMAKEAR